MTVPSALKPTASALLLYDVEIRTPFLIIRPLETPLLVS
jgi:hypothetical protein